MAPSINTSFSGTSHSPSLNQHGTNRLVAWSVLFQAQLIGSRNIQLRLLFISSLYQHLSDINII